MAYCTVAEVERMLLGETYGASSTPTRGRVEEICDQQSAVIDGYLAAAGYTLPISGASALLFLKEMARICVAVQVWFEGHTSDTAPPKIEAWRDECRQFKSDLREDKVRLPGLTPESDAQPFFAIAPGPQRDLYWSTGQLLDEE